MLHNAKIAEITGPNGEVFEIVFVSAYGDSWNDHGIIDKEKNCIIYHGAIQARQKISNEKIEEIVQLNDLKKTFSDRVNDLRSLYLRKSLQSPTLEHEKLLHEIYIYSQKEVSEYLLRVLIENMNYLATTLWSETFCQKNGFIDDVFEGELRKILKNAHILSSQLKEDNSLEEPQDEFTIFTKRPFFYSDYLAWRNRHC